MRIKSPLPISYYKPDESRDSRQQDRAILNQIRRASRVAMNLTLTLGANDRAGKPTDKNAVSKLVSLCADIRSKVNGTSRISGYLGFDANEANSGAQELRRAVSMGDKIAVRKWIYSTQNHLNMIHENAGIMNRAIVRADSVKAITRAAKSLGLKRNSNPRQLANELREIAKDIRQASLRMGSGDIPPKAEMYAYAKRMRDVAGQYRSFRLYGNTGDVIDFQKHMERDIKEYWDYVNKAYRQVEAGERVSASSPFDRTVMMLQNLAAYLMRSSFGREYMRQRKS